MFQVYLQRIKQEDADSEMIMEVNRELDNLLEIQTILNTDYNSYDKITEAKPGTSSVFWKHIWQYIAIQKIFPKCSFFLSEVNR